MLNSKHFEGLLDSVIGKEIPGAVLAVADVRSQFIGARGNLKSDSQFFIASATKLYVTALLLQLIDSNKLRLGDKIVDLLPHEQVRGLHVIDGMDYSNQITIEHLLSHTSGLPDYFQAIRKTKTSLMDQILAGEDQKWNLDQVLKDSKELGAVFPPSSGKALYSDTNYQILGSVIETLTESSLAASIHNSICKRIGLTKTYLYQDERDLRPALLNYKKKVLNIPKAMTSFGADGGVVSTAPEGIEFLKAFFNGQLFNRAHLDHLTARWRNIFYPLKYGVGISLFRLPWYFSPLKQVPDLIGHSGLSGAFLFHCPSKNIYLSGTVNQISKPQTSFRLMIKTLMGISE